ncbi:tripartite motif-containing protein 66 isoform X3 [Xenopus laevis]|uniref:Tripartite motif-containing protein 66 isoform X3 n=1 Tax=Xenopus laevis TaxID=8355 RepID=A0A8J1KHY3_XENLA|nr:tripartite motif-containing protein 66 isoform X3 [Xenopus laevis]
MAKSCFDCTEKNSAHSLCITCNKWLCSTCAEQHRHTKSVTDPFLPSAQRGSLGGDGTSGNFLSCPMHHQEPLKLFCENCDTLMCRHCVVMEHKDHRFRRLDEALQHQRALLENVITQVEEKKIVVQAAGKQIEDRLYEIKHMHSKVENQIKVTKMVLINELNKRTNVLMEQLEKTTTEKRHKYEQQLQSVLVLNRQLEHVQNFINWAMYGKNSIPFLFSKELIVYQMQHLLDTSCGGDVGRPSKIRFSWEPSFWTKQISNLGCIMADGAQLPTPEIPSYGTESAQTSYYPMPHAPITAHPGTITSSPHYTSSVQCPTPMCCTHCHTLPTMPKNQPATGTITPHMSFAHPTPIKQQPPSAQYNSGKEQKPTVRPLRVIQPWVSHQPHSEPENSSYWLDHQQQKPQVPPSQPNAPPVCPVTPQDFNQVHNVHPIQHTVPITTPTSLQTPSVLQVPSVQMQVSSVHSLSHIQPQRQQAALCQAESAHEQVMHHSLDIINQQFELEQMQKGLELLLQSQPSNVQLNQAKQPQHVQQTIVGQINYIVRQPAAAPLQPPEEIPQVCDDPISPGSHTVDLSPVTTISPGNMQSQSIADEIIAAVENDACQRNQLADNPDRKRSASVGFCNAAEMELSSPRLSRSVDPQMPTVSCQFFEHPEDRGFLPATEAERLAEYSAVEAGVTDNIHIATEDHQATAASALGNAICKVEIENFSCANNSAIETDLQPESAPTVSEFILPLPEAFEEPINLSVKKCPPPESSSVIVKKRTNLPPAPAKPLKHETEDSGFKQHFADNRKGKKSKSRAPVKETMIPYVRLERLKIQAQNSGELPVFKVQPQKKDEDGSVRLVVKYGAQCKSMSIKVNPDCPSPSPQTTPQPTVSYETDPLSYTTSQTISELEQQVNNLARVSPYSGDTSTIHNRIEIPAVPAEDLDLTRKVNAVPQPIRKLVQSEDHNQIENEDFCAVCLNGGEMLCCDHCPKVYHLSCHVPALLSFPVGEWLCTLCRNMTKPEVEYDCDNVRYSLENKLEIAAFPNLDDYDQRKCEKLVLSLCCNSLSLPFQEPVSPLARHYYQIIKRPMDLSIIRKKLQRRNIPHYSAPEELVYDIRLMFWNCAKFNYEDSEVAEAGRNLEMYFENMLKEAYPEKVFPFPQEEDSDTEEIGSESCHLNLKGFHWPPYGPDYLQPKRRRRHTLTQKPRDFDIC